MTKDRLLEYRALLRERRHIEDILGDLEASLYSPKNQKLTGMPGRRITFTAGRWRRWEKLLERYGIAE